jgi:hypothetical protein
MKRNLILLVLLAALPAFPAEYYVDAFRPDDSGTATNWATAKQTIQAAVDLTTDGDTVWVTNGVYSTGGAVAPPFSLDYSTFVITNSLTNRVCITNSITVRSVNGPEVTVIRGASDNGTNGPAAVRGAFLLSGSVMDGFTFTGGYTSVAEYWGDCFGGGVFLRKNATLNNCILTGNSATFGGGAYVDYGTLNNCLLTGNFSSDGGGAYVNGGTLNNCTVVGNFVSEFTSRRQGGWGGGVIVSAGYLNNCIVWGNTAVNEDDIVVADSTVLYSCTSPLPEGEGNICADPMFKNSSSNYRLRQGSPCVDAGSNSNAPATDLDGVARPVDGDNNGSAIADMGCYEWSVASLPKTYFVDASRPGDSGVATNWATAKQTIQAAVDLANDEDTVWVTNGVYDTGGMVAPTFRDSWGYPLTSALTNRVCLTKAITVSSVNGAAVTIIQGASDNGANGPAAIRCVRLFPGAVMEGFTLTGGHTYADSNSGWYDDAGGGALLHVKAVLNSCILNGNSAFYEGGGVFVLAGGTLNNCLLAGNSATYRGGGVSMESYGGTLNNCTVSRNLVTGDGRTGTYGSGVFASFSTLNNCVVWGNTGAEKNIAETWSTTLMILNTCSSPLPEGEGNICADPMFVDAVNSNFKLQAGSPCINAGNNSTVSTTNDLAGNPRIVAGVVDMGAYEFYGAQDDYDGDGIPNEWEVRYFGNIGRAVATAICSNGFNTIREAYIAGLDPINAASFFEVDGKCTDDKNVLWWNATSGRVYSVYYSTNLLNGFQPMVTNIPWTAGAFTDTVHKADGSGFYKIHVRLE